jgi:hypothetical protein
MLLGHFYDLSGKKIIKNMHLIVFSPIIHNWIIREHWIELKHMHFHPHQDIKKANNIDGLNRFFTLLAAPITDLYTASRGVQAFEKAVRCQIFATLFCLINGAGRGAVTGTLSAEITRIALMVQPFAAFGFWLSFDPNDIVIKRLRGALSFIQLSNITHTFADLELELPGVGCVTQENQAEAIAEIFKILMTGYLTCPTIASENIFRKIEQQAAEKSNKHILKNIAPSSILSSDDLRAAQISYWIQDYALTTNLLKELNECKSEKNKIAALHTFLSTLKKEMAASNSVDDKTLRPPFRTIKQIAQSIITLSKNNAVRKTVEKTLTDFLIYITKIKEQINKPLQKKIDSEQDEERKEELLKIQKKLIERLYRDVLDHQLADHRALIRNKKTAFSSCIGFIFIAGNLIVYSTFAVIGGKDLIDKTTHWLIHYMANFLSPHALLFLQSPPVFFPYLIASLFFGIPTLLVSWHFGGSAVKKMLLQVSMGNNKNPLKKNTNKWLFIVGFLISALGSNMLFFHYIATTFVNIPLFLQLWLELSIFISTMALFINLYTDSMKKYKAELTEYIHKQLEDKKCWQKFGIKISSSISLFLIFSILCFVPVYADTISAKKLLLSKGTKFFNICYLNLNHNVALSLIISVGFLSALFNIVYAFKAAVIIYQKLMDGFNTFVSKDLALQQKFERVFLFAIATTAILLLSTQRHLSLVNLGLAIMTCFICCVFYKLAIKLYQLRQCAKEEKISKKDTHLQKKFSRLFVIFLTSVLLFEAIMARTVWTSKALETIYTPFLITMMSIIATGYVCWNITCLLFTPKVNKQDIPVDKQQNTKYPTYLKFLQYILFAALTTSFLSLCFKSTYLGRYADYTTTLCFSFCIISIIIKRLANANVKQGLLENETIQQVGQQNYAVCQHC